MNTWGNLYNSQSPIVTAQPRAPSSEPSFIEIIDSKVYFYADIDRDKVLQLVKNIRQMNINLKLIQQQHDIIEPIKIQIYINSYGGSIFAGLSVADEILKSTLPVYTVVDGCCASAATLFSVVAKKRFIKPHSYMLIHQLSSVCWGKHEEFRDELVNQKRLMDMIKNIYTTYTKIPLNKLNQILKHDLWFDAKTCLEYGLVDEIL